MTYHINNLEQKIFGFLFQKIFKPADMPRRNPQRELQKGPDKHQREFYAYKNPALPQIMGPCGSCRKWRQLCSVLFQGKFSFPMAIVCTLFVENKNKTVSILTESHLAEDRLR